MSFNDNYFNLLRLLNRLHVVPESTVFDYKLFLILEELKNIRRVSRSSLDELNKQNQLLKDKGDE